MVFAVSVTKRKFSRFIIIHFCLVFVLGTAAIIGALSLHSVVGMIMTHPVEWHAKKLEDVRAEKAAALLHSGRLAYFGGRLDEARQLNIDSLSLYRQLDDYWGEASALNRLGWVAVNSGAYAEAHQFFQASLR